MSKPGKKTSKSLTKEIWERFCRNRMALIALIILIVFTLLAIFADVIVDYETCITVNVKDRLQKPSRQHIMGTDAYGRDVFARIIHGARISLLIGVLSSGFSMIIACILGASAGYYGGIIESVIMRIVDILTCIPSILLTLCLVAILGGSMQNLIIALTIGLIPTFSRVVRSVVINLKGSDFIEAAKAAGSSDFRIIFTHILPNAIGPIIVQATMNVSNAILQASSFSFIGLGVQPPMPEWGTMLSEAKNHMRNVVTLAFFPGGAIAITALCFNLAGDGLRDALDPKLKD
ncbi:MAG: ABC transporter permease [Acetivibrionales bacterium]